MGMKREGSLFEAELHRERKKLSEQYSRVKGLSPYPGSSKCTRYTTSGNGSRQEREERTKDEKIRVLMDRRIITLSRLHCCRFLLLLF